MCKFPIKIYHRPDPKDKTPIWHLSNGKSDTLTGDLPYHLVPCGRCIDCLRRRKNDWYVRARFEKDYGDYRQILWVSLTFRDDRLPSDRADISSRIRSFKDRLRKHPEVGFFPTHFFISERGGHDQDGRIHLHGLLYFEKEIRYDVIRHCWEPFEGFCWLEPIKTARAITYCFKYAFKGIHQRIKGDCLTGYVWASLGFGNTISPKRLFNWFRPADDHKFSNIFTFDSRWNYAIPRYLIGKVIETFGYKKQQSFKDLMKMTFDLYFTREERLSQAISLGQYIPKPKSILNNLYGSESNPNTIHDTWSYST